MFVTSLLCASLLVAPGERMVFPVGDIKRDALVYPGQTATRTGPLVFCFHGHGQSGEVARNLFMLQTAWPEAFVCYPNGIGGIPDDDDPEGIKTGWQKDPGQVEDRDLKFYDKMLADISSKYKIDKKRIYICGFSNGGRMTFLLWAQRFGDMAATAVFSSSPLRSNLYQSFKPLPTMVSCGLEDENFGYDNWLLGTRRVLEMNKCDPREFDRVNGKPGMTSYQPQPGGALTVQWTHRGGHIPPPKPADEIVAFFKRFHL